MNTPVTHQPEYTAWAGMVQRCTDANATSYQRYGAIGVAVCQEWLPPGGFERFIEHIGPRPTSKHQIDRIKGELGYQPGNVRWSTAAEQARNRKSNIMVTIDGVTLCAQDWANINGIPPFAAFARIRLGWDRVRAVTEPVLGEHLFFGERLKVSAAAEKFGLSRGALANRLWRGWDPDDAVTAPRGMKHSVWMKRKQGEQQK